MAKGKEAQANESAPVRMRALRAFGRDDLKLRVRPGNEFEVPEDYARYLEGTNRDKVRYAERVTD